MFNTGNKKALSSGKQRAFRLSQGNVTMKTIPFTIDSDKTLDLVDLLPKIPIEISYKMRNGNPDPLTNDEEELVKKIGNAADNAGSSLPLGIAAIGELLGHASDEVSSDAVRNIGWLIESLGRQIHALHDIKEHTDYVISQNHNIKSKFRPS